MTSQLAAGRRLTCEGPGCGREVETWVEDGETVRVVCGPACANRVKLAEGESVRQGQPVEPGVMP